MYAIRLSIIGIFLCICPALPVAQIPFSCTGQFYISFTTPATSSLVEAVIDPATDQVEFVPISNNLGTFINGAGYRATDNLIYAVQPIRYNLYQIDAVGNVRDLKQLLLNPNHAFLAGDVSPDGQFLVLIGTLRTNSGSIDETMVFVDLTSPDYTVTSRSLQGPVVNMLDIAFDPTDGTLYGVDSRGDRLVTIDFNTGLVSTPFPVTPVMDDAGSLFFDSFGDLFAYGGPPGNNGIQNTLYKVDKRSGEFTILTTGTRAIATDGCSCPHTVELRKDVTPRLIVPCGDVQYTFTIANTSTTPQGGIIFEDILPNGFVVSHIVYNPYGGQVVSGPGSQTLLITDMTLLPGIDSIVVIVTTGDLPDGIYKNQAMLSGLPNALGVTVLSDDPRTLVKRDSTTLTLRGYTGDVFHRIYLCAGETLNLDVRMYGNTFEWHDGSTAGSYPVSRAGIYSVRAATSCDTILVTFEVLISETSVAFVPDNFEIQMSDSILLIPQVFNTGETTLYNWGAPEGIFVECATCPQIEVAPLRDIEYHLVVSNEHGCLSSASVVIRVDQTRRFFAPNIFSPNGDGINDVFYLRIRGRAEVLRFHVFDRWGGLVHASSTGVMRTPEVQWHGNSAAGIVPPGVYVWMAEVRFADGSQDVFAGDVTVIR